MNGTLHSKSGRNSRSRKCSRASTKIRQQKVIEKKAASREASREASRATSRASSRKTSVYENKTSNTTDMGK